MRKEDIVGIATDNTAFLCGTQGLSTFLVLRLHVANLTLCAILRALGLKDQPGWRALRRGAAGQD